MKNVKFLKSVFFAFLAITTFSCSDDDDAGAPQSNTIAAIASRTPDLSILVQALDRAGLVAAVDGTTQLTVFAPTNEAFENFLEANGFDDLEDVPVPLLTQVLLNHVVTGAVQSTQLPDAGYIQTLATLNGEANGNNLSMYVNKSTGVRLNGVSSVVTGSANIIASNGVVHVVDAVIGLPTVVTFAVADPNFDTLQAALTTLTPATDFAAILGRTQGGNADGINPPFTVFAPINTAFADLDAELAPGGIASLTEGQITTTLLYHVVGGANVRSNQIPAGPITSLETGTFSITGTTITDERARTSGIIAVDVQASNGVIHAINKVILPNF
jgi:uncharacterized surface protein with fasciclin (FAS1) repeats